MRKVTSSSQGSLDRGGSVKWSVSGALGVALLTVIMRSLKMNLATASSCFLLELVLLSLTGSYAAAVIVSLLAVASLSYYFATPIYSFRFADPTDIAGVIAFLVTGLIITRLVTKVRAKNESTLLQKEQLQTLYGLAQTLLELEPDTTGQHDFLQPFLGVFGIRAVCLYDAMSSEVHTVGNASGALEEKTGQSFIQSRDLEAAAYGISARCFRVGGRTIGAIGFDGLEASALTAGPLAALAAAQLERTHSFLKASRSTAAAQTESYRTAILDALAHEFKTPLATILAAAGSLQEGESLGAHHREMAETVEAEAARLGRLTSRLLRTARLEREAVKPWIEWIDIASVVYDTVEQYQKQSGGHKIVVYRDRDSSKALADPELLRLAVSQLLDNACKYSKPGSPVALRIEHHNNAVVLRICTQGNKIPPTERNKIFDRFYRGIDARNTHGSGLGLYVARKIAIALGGTLELENDGASEGTVFRLALSAPESEQHDLALTG